MAIAYTRWPDDVVASYRNKGYWTDLPLFDILARKANSSARAVVDAERVLTYLDLNRLSDNLASALQKRGLRTGDTALVHIGNAAELYIVYFGLLKLGVVPVNALYSHRQLELDSYATQIQPKLLIGDRKNPLFKDDKYVEHLKTLAPLSTIAFMNEASGPNSLWELLNTDCGTFTPTPTPADEVAFLNLSGGSTGTPKLIPRTHNDYYYSVRRSVEICEFDDSTRFLCAIPAAHNFSMSSPGALGVFYAGGQVVMAPDPSASSCFPLIEKHEVTVAALVPPAASLWLQEVQDKGENEPLKSLKLLQLGGARLSPTLAARLAENLKCKLQQVFGMAEGLVNYTRLDDDEQKILTTQGRPMSEADEVWVSDTDGNRLAAGEVGLLMTRGPYTFRGYYNAPEHNAKSFDKNGFYCSGDLIAIDEDGYITVHGRQKDQINRGGEKISTEEIENLLLRHPSVIEAGLVAMEDDHLGEKSCAFIMVKEAIKAVQLRKFLREQGIAEYKLPDKFQILEEMPLTAVGKVDKKQLRELLINN